MFLSVFINYLLIVIAWPWLCCFSVLIMCLSEY